MSAAAGGLSIIKNGLILYLDASNTKSLADVPSINLLLNSQQFENWNKYQSSVSANTTTAPDGTTTADTNIETSGLPGNRGVQQQLPGMVAGQTYTFSIYAKNFNGRNIQMAVFNYSAYANSYSSNFNLQTGVIVSNGNSGNGVRTNSSIVSVGNGWYRCSISGYMTSVTQLQPNINLLSGNTVSYTGDGVSGVYLWGGQFEVGPVATTYIPTTTVAVSRIPKWSDVSKGDNNGTLSSGLTYNYLNGGSLIFNSSGNTYTRVDSTILNDSGGTINVWCYPTGVPSAGFSGYIVSTIGTNSDRFYVLFTASGSFSLIRGNPAIGISTGNLPLNVWYNVTFTWTSSIINGYLNGIQFGVPTSYTASGNTTNFAIGSYMSPFGTQGFTGNIAKTLIYNRALSSSEVQQNYNTTKSKFGL